MRILFVASPSLGHVFPVVPLAWALRGDGHEVLVATAGKSLAAAQAGLPVVDVAPGWDTGSIMRQVLPEFVARMAQARQQPGVGRPPARRMTDLRAAADGFGPVSDFITDAVVDVADTWRPDLVISTQLDGAGMVAAAVLGVPLVAHGFGIARGAGVFERYQDLMAPAAARHGVTTLPLPVATIDIAPPSLVDGDPYGWSMRPVPYNGAGLVPADLVRAPAPVVGGAAVVGGGGRPRIAVTLGTVVPELHGYDTVRAVVDAAAGLDVDLLLALGDADQGAVGPLPPNARTVGWLPLNALLPSCSAIIHHGGSGTTFAALDAAVPQLFVTSGGGDQVITAEAVAKRGAGLHVEGPQVQADLIEQLLADPALRTAAAQVQAELHTMPAPATLVPRLRALAAG